MIEIYRSKDRSLERITELVPGAWINVQAPTTEEIAWLQDTLAAPADFITYSLDADERARIEREDGAILIVLRVPFAQGPNADAPYTTVPLGIVIVNGHVATISSHHTDVIADLSTRRVRTLSTVKRNRFVLHLLLRTAQRYLSDLTDINRAVDAVEDRLQRSLRNQELLELLKYQKSLVYFTTALKGNELMLHRLQRSGLFDAYPDDQDLLDDVLTEMQQAIEVVGITSNILSGMMDAFASIISNNLNVVMKILASVTIVLSIPTILTSAFGMNVDLPLASLDRAFGVIVGLSAATCLAVVVLFWRRDWL